jgi:hypothetical protein
LELHNGIICDGTVQVRRIAFHGASPGSFDGMNLKIARWDEDIEANITSTEESLFEFE